VQVASIGIPADLPELAQAQTELASAGSVHELLPPRPRSAHKGTFGRVIVAAGSVPYTGAAYLAGAAAYRAGAGLVTLAVPLPIYPVVAALLPEATWIMLAHEMGVIAPAAADVLAAELGSAQALLLGPGFGREKATRDFLRRLLAAEETKKGRIGFVQPDPAGSPAAAPRKLPPMVVDADGLRLLAEIEGWPTRLSPGAVLTPHPGEMAAMTGLDRDSIQADRAGIARKHAGEWGHVVVLKGAFTVVAAPDGRVTVMPFATPALARAGTGDVLAGAIAGLLGQGVEPYTAAVAGAYVHGLAGELAAQRLGTTAGVIARDVLAALPSAIARTEAKPER
jgi:NAD(P)H-hydrate epimerase